PDESEDGKASLEEIRADRVEDEVQGGEGPAHEEHDSLVDDDQLTGNLRREGDRVERHRDRQSNERIEEGDDQGRNGEDHQELRDGIESMKEAVALCEFERPDRARHGDVVRQVARRGRLSQGGSPPRPSSTRSSGPPPGPTSRQTARRREEV